MKRLCTDVLALALVAALVPSIVAATVETSAPGEIGRAFGEKMTVDPAETLDATKVLADPSAYEGRKLRLKGTVQDVCQSRGCWLTLGEKDKDASLFVKFTCPIEGRLIPREAVGHQAIVEGTLNIKEIPEDVAQHLAEESGKKEADIAAIKGPQKQIEMSSPAALILGLEGNEK